ncbi:B12-binding domain-containing radical SAM protein [Rhodocytophaga rosea]|uniref:B12-binding domain-containing radical SAM protein n=1 Tax=Rhodocytophaga rosea TaxID=2704465 RepID=A0A6C0GNK9_9BACT|nr:radical SAM protein [Rhodocytophaga rosea]QHT69631.1 B12-binding domain-containing radical SAM protein [Rhodocytophaga rosea]
MPKILFTHSYFLYLDPKQWKAANAYPPLGTLYAAALLRENGYEVSLFDSMLAHSPQQIAPVLKSKQPDLLVIYDDGFNYLSKMCLTNMREAAFHMIGLAKQQGCTIIISSSDSTDHYEKYLQQGADVVILGEGEITLLALVNSLNKQQAYSAIDGIAYQENGQTIANKKRPVLRDLDLLPLPAWDLVDIASYKKLWKKKHGYFSLNVVTTRGCTYKCNWCAKPLFGNRYHARSPKNVVEELQLLVHTFGAEHIWFCDDIFGLKPGWIQQFADLVAEKKLQFTFKIQSRADLLIHGPTVENLSKAGCQMVWLGAESGSQKILDAMDKGITIQQIYESRKLLQAHGIQAAFFLQFGYPGEVKTDIQATIRMVLDLLPEDIGISVTYPLPGTQLYERVKAELKEKTNWQDSDELSMLFHNTYPEGFYKDLQRYVHKLYRRQKSIQSLKKLVHSPFSLDRKQIRSAISAFYRIPAATLKDHSLDHLIIRYGGSF